MNQGSSLTVAVLGAGLIGIDLLTKIQRSRFLDCQLVVARDDQARGLRRAPPARGGSRLQDRWRWVTLLAADRQDFDIVFDASNAVSHAEHWEYVETLGAALVVDLTPSTIGHMITPTVNRTDALAHRNVNSRSCDGQFFFELGRRQAVGGQEDLIVDVAMELSRHKSTNPS